MLTRRQLLKTGVAGAAVLGFARLSYGPIRPDRQFAIEGATVFTVLDSPSRTTLAAIARAMLEGTLPPADEQHVALARTVHGCDVVIAGLPPAAQAELKQLLALLNGRLTRRWVVGLLPAWEDASDEDIAHFLDRWRYSSFMLLRSGYQALHQIIFAAWYGEPSAWPAIHYEGPPEFMKAYWNA